MLHRAILEGGRLRRSQQTMRQATQSLPQKGGERFARHAKLFGHDRMIGGFGGEQGHTRQAFAWTLHQEQRLCAVSKGGRWGLSVALQTQGLDASSTYVIVRAQCRSIA